MNDFPSFVSLTVTNHCNLTCQMCAQWSESGYMHQRDSAEGGLLALADWPPPERTIGLEPCECGTVCGGARGAA